MSSSECMRIDADDTDRILGNLTAERHVTAQAKTMRGGYALAILLDEGLPTERAVVVNADGVELDVDADVSDVVHTRWRASAAARSAPTRTPSS
jgi:hypothetical protein